MESQERLPLFVEVGTETVPEYPALIGGKCSCGHIFFPMQTYGCEKCGRSGDDLKPAMLSGIGKLHAFSQVHLHARPYPKVPFTVVVIELDDGPIVRALNEPAVDETLRAGIKMVATLVQEEHDGQPRSTLRFKRAEKGEA